ncbi:MAG: beta-lactamase family protein, partial [Clostridia bacterium]|nr:beta-lactamase family protein [Clostridia bacterium]
KVEDKLRDVLGDSFPEKPADPRWADVTVEHAICHRTGLPGGHLDIDCAPYRSFGDDFLAYCFATPLEYDPGTDEKYADGSTYLVSRIVAAASGETLDRFLWKNLLDKMDFGELAWSCDPDGHPIGATGLHIHSEDLVKLPYLYMKGGVYKDVRLLSEEWCSRVLEKQYVFEPNETGEFYFKGGMYGQKMVLIPAFGVAFAEQSFHADSGKIADFVLDYLKKHA